jgi:heptosyltransferase-2/heptosyltransferase-3
MIRGLARTMMREALLRRSVDPYEPAEKHVLIIRPDHLGDLLLVRPALKRFRAQLPDWRVTLMVGPWSKAIVERDPNIDEIVTFPFPGFTRAAASNPAEPYRQLFDVATQIRERHPAAVVVLRDDHWWGALAARQAGAPLIIGADLPAMHGLLTDRVAVDGLHSVARNVALLNFTARRLGSEVVLPPADSTNAPLTWEIHETDRQRARQLLENNDVSGRYVVIHPGSGAPVKLWPAERWAKVADRVAEAGYSVVLSGSDSELPLLRRINASSDSTHSLGGQTTVQELAAVFERAETVLGVDSGPLHLAVAVNVPTIHLYGPSDVATYGPWGNPARHPVIASAMTCPQCGNLDPSRPEGSGCMLAIGTDGVVDAFHRLVSA